MPDSVTKKPYRPFPAPKLPKTDILKQSKGQFRPGQSGNPKGRPQGSKNKATLAALALLEGDLEIITRKLVEKAKAGESWAIKLIMDKLVPNAKDLPVTFPLPRLEKAEDLQSAMASILKAMSQGKLTPQEARDIAEIMSSLAQTQLMEDLERKVKELQEMKQTWG